MWVVRLIIYLAKKTFEYAHNALVVIVVVALLALWGYNTVAPPDKGISFTGMIESVDRLTRALDGAMDYFEDRPWEVE